jgi:hypothetical protein
MKLSDFKLKPATNVTQEQLEAWNVAVQDATGGKPISDLHASTYRRVIVEGAVAAGWFEELPKGFKQESLKGMKPGNLSEVARLVDSFYMEISSPDEDFISAPPTP